MTDHTAPVRVSDAPTDMTHWHHALMEPPEIERDEPVLFGPHRPTMIQAKSDLLPVIFMVASGPTAPMADQHTTNAKLATQWLCGDNMTMTVEGYHFAVLECDGSCQGTYTGFQRAVHDLRRMNNRDTTPRIDQNEKGN
ncbi:hypothetical protein [Nocardia alni]|uniref:hypothetical protein n=1 Tax=Nocardia alni TaxID=2815723 RepID=UPI001C24357D|nr:hypothetical protein [Nocardia alni]